MDALELRRLDRGDEPYLRELIWFAARWADAQPPPRPSPLPAELELYVAGFGRQTDRGLLAVSGAAPAGACWIREQGHGYGFVADGIGELSIAIVPHLRRRGVGRELIRGVLDQEAGPISLSVDPRNPALRLYEELGFARVGEFDGSWTMLRDGHAVSRRDPQKANVRPAPRIGSRRATWGGGRWPAASCAYPPPTPGHGPAARPPPTEELP